MAVSRSIERAASMGWVHAWLSAQSAILVLASVNRLTNLTTGFVAANEFLRWVDLLNMLVLPLASTLVLWLLWREVARNSSMAGATSRVALELAFVVGIYLLAASYGTHEVTNYLNQRFCFNGGSGPDASMGAVALKMCDIIAFNDDEFSHYVFFAGFSIVNAALMLLQWAHPFTSPVARRDLALLVVNGGFIALALFANLAFEAIGLDLWVVVGLTALALGLLWRVGRQPLLVYYSVAYGGGLAMTAALLGLAG